MKTQQLGDKTVVLDSTNIQTPTSTTEKSADNLQIGNPLKKNDTKAVPVKEKCVKKSSVDSNVHIVKPKKELLTTVENFLEKQTSTHVVQPKKSEINVIPPKTPTLKPEASAEAVRIDTPVKEDDIKSVTKNKKGVKKTLEKSIISVDEPEIKSFNTQKKSLKKNSISVNAPKKSENTILKSKNLDEVHTSKLSSATVDIISSVESNNSKNAKKNNKNQVKDDKTDQNTKIQKSGTMIVVFDSPITQLSTSKIGTCAETVKKIPPVTKNEAKVFPKIEIRTKKSLIETIIHIVKPKKESIVTQSSAPELQPLISEETIICSKASTSIPSLTETKNEALKIVSSVNLDSTNEVQKHAKVAERPCKVNSKSSGDLTSVIKSPIIQLSTMTTTTTNEAVHVLLPVIEDNTKEDPRNEIFTPTTTSYKMSLEKVSPTSVEMANDSVKTDKIIESTVKENMIIINDNEKDTNTKTRKSVKDHNENTKSYSKTDIRNYFSAQTPKSRKPNVVDELCHSSFNKSLNGLDQVNNKKVPIEKLPVCTAEPFASVYKQNNGAITFLNQPLDDEFLGSPDFLTVIYSCLSSLSKYHKSQLPNQNLSKGNIHPKQ